MGASTHSFQEGFIRNESIVILWITALLDEDVHLLPLQLLSEGEEDVLQLTQHHCSVLHLVVQLETLDKVLVGAGVLGLLDLRVDGEELLELDELLSLLLGATQFFNHLEGGVLVEPPQTVAQIEQVHAGLALEVIDVKGKLCSFNVLVSEIMSHD